MAIDLKILHIHIVLFNFYILTVGNVAMFGKATISDALWLADRKKSQPILDNLSQRVEMVEHGGKRPIVASSIYLL